MRALDLFSGGGGSSYGARLAGVTTVGAVDLWAIATQTYAENFPEAKTFTSSLEKIDPKHLLRQLGPVDLIMSSPECTHHTCAKGNKPRSEESRATAMQLLRFAKVFQPRWLVLENVVHMRPWSGYPELIRELQILGYYVKEHTLDASKFGVPQKRRRLFVTADREVEPPDIKIPTKSRPKTVQHILDKHGQWPVQPLFKKGRANDTLKRAARAFKTLGEDAPFLIVYYGSDGSGGWQSLDRPLRTITTVDRFGLVEPGKDGPTLRMLQVPELRRAMGFGDDYQMLAGTRRDKIKLLGNAVCPPVMAAVLGSLVTG